VIQINLWCVSLNTKGIAILNFMNKLFKTIFSKLVKRRLDAKDESYTRLAYAKELKSASIEFIHIVQDIFFILLGVVSASFGLKGFLLPNSFIDGGVTGISLITSELTGISLSILLVIINLPFIIIGYSTISRVFAIKSILAILLLALVVHFMEYPIITDDKLLIAVFGGFFLGLGIGLAIRGGAVIDGTEVLAVFINRKTPLTIGDVVLLFNVVIFSVATYVFTIEIALYAILTYLAAAKTVDFVVDGIEEYMGVTIITDKSEEMRLAITEKLGRGCTLYSGKKGFAKRGEVLQDTDVVFTVVTRLEMAKLQTEIDKVDLQAFTIMQSIKEAKGGMIKKRPLTK
jgi:uncharacterized membrane-anchored protein YitT (DUF2179 family)